MAIDPSQRWTAEREPVSIDVLEEPRLREISAFAEVLDWLAAKTEGKRLPARKDINPAEIKPHLPNIFLWDLIFDDGELVDIKLRLVGTGVTEIYGEVTGQLWSNYPVKRVRDRGFDGARHTIAERVPNGYAIHGISEQKSHIGVYAMYVPLADDTGRITMILGMVQQIA